MTKLTATIDGIHGDVQLILERGKEKQTCDFKWCIFDETGSTGFISSLTTAPIILTEVAAEHFLRLTISSMVRTFELKPGDLTIVNHLGEKLPDVQFLPPTFKGNEAELINFVAQQDSLLRLHSIYEKAGKLDQMIIDLASEEGVVDDFLSLVQVRASGIFLTVNKPSQ